MKEESTQEHNLLEIIILENTAGIFQQVIEFLQLFMPVTLSKRLVAVILLAIGIPVREAMGLAGLCEKSMRT